MRTIAALAVAEGLAPKDALKCITSNPAEILSCQNHLGQIAKGYDADLVIFDRDPLDINAKVMHTIINGQVVYTHELRDPHKMLKMS